ncbi:hypothetical protein PPL_06981 [Heterostelium album PN500]|uniref:Polymorphic outer membrane protein n=1 Tax=Heterostelium pallidum (strain ATCC 26659 / Pp 5 / PN500) TaxID=670386 RepID=D3BE28_HETP5|nr:hypothetical protein PPL_06981 [Heterostelium album PN500]EFA80159.1 hypothetical protein PPL_06981 [Heterostelium album PN500]|eukprot:XP_020432279.1 hypothetical protein PPL_06981 [Heterostelium album PN500]
MNKLIVVITFLVFISLCESHSVDHINIPPRYADVQNQIANANSSTLVCTLSMRVKSCQTSNNQIQCPSVAQCLQEFSKSKDSYGSFAVSIPNFLFDSSYLCSGVVSDFNITGEILISSANGGNVYIDCKESQFLEVTLVGPTTFVLQGIDFIGCHSPINGGCLNIINHNESILIESSVYVYNSSSNGNRANYQGGFINADVGYISISNSTFNENSAIYASRTGGGVIYCSNGTVDIENSNFTNNNVQGANAGVVFSENLLVSNSTFDSNYAGTSGGAFYVNGYTSILNSVFTYNKVSLSGGVIYSPYGIIYITNSYFSGNNANNVGSVIYGGNITIENSKFEANTGVAGGVIYSTYQMELPTLISVNNSFFINNEVYESGAAIYAYCSDLNIQNTVFRGNQAQNGGAIYISNSYRDLEINVTSSIFEDQTVSKSGGAIYISTPYPGNIYLNLFESIFLNNVAKSYAGGIYFQQVPISFIGGLFNGSRSSEIQSGTFYSLSTTNINIVSFSNINEISVNYVPFYDEAYFSMPKALGAFGQCVKGYATIDEYGDVISCKCYSGGSGPHCT